MDLATAASWAEIIGLITIIGAAFYSFYQIKEMQASRDSAAALTLSEHFHRPEFVAGVVELVYQPEEIDSMEKLKKYHGERWPDVVAVMTTWESMGAMVHRGDLDFHLVYDLYSGLIVSLHDIANPLIQAERERFDDSRFEWFTWLSDRVRSYDESAGTPHAAHIQFADWTPPQR